MKRYVTTAVARYGAVVGDAPLPDRFVEPRPCANCTVHLEPVDAGHHRPVAVHFRVTCTRDLGYIQGTVPQTHPVC
jgi:hypothetical protein